MWNSNFANYLGWWNYQNKSCRFEKLWNFVVYNFLIWVGLGPQISNLHSVACESFCSYINFLYYLNLAAKYAQPFSVNPNWWMQIQLSYQMHIESQGIVLVHSKQYWVSNTAGSFEWSVPLYSYWVYGCYIFNDLL